MTHQEALNIAAQAWERVKPEDDPPFEQCAQDHKFRLAYKVESVAQTGRVEDEFDHAVKAILSAPSEVPVVVEAEPPVSTDIQTNDVGGSKSKAKSDATRAPKPPTTPKGKAKK